MSEVTLTPRDYVRVLFRQKAVLITAVLTVMITVLIGLELKTPEYKAGVRMLITAEKQTESPFYRDLLGSRNMEVALTQSEIVKSNPVLERAISVLGLHERPLDYENQFASRLKQKLNIVQLKNREFTRQLETFSSQQQQGLRFRLALESLKRSVKVDPVRDTNIFTISVTDFSPVGAAVIANVVSRSYVIYDLEQQMAELQLKYGDKHQSVQQLREDIDGMVRTLSGRPLDNVDAFGPASVKIIEQAVVALRPEGLPKLYMAILAFFMSIFLGVMLAFMFEYLDQTIRSPRDISDYLNLPYLGFIRRKPKHHDYVTLAGRLAMRLKDSAVQAILMTSALKGEGVSTIMANLGKALAQETKKKILIIDAATVKSPTKPKLLKTQAKIDAPVKLTTETSFDVAVRPLEGNLSLLSLSEAALEAPVSFETYLMKFLNVARDRFDLVLIDAGHLRDNELPAQLAGFVDAVLLVVKEGHTRRQVGQFELKPLQERNINFLGAILNFRSFDIPAVVYNRI